jgi:hypothetical protein
MLAWVVEPYVASLALTMVNVVRVVIENGMAPGLELKNPVAALQELVVPELIGSVQPCEPVVSEPPGGKGGPATRPGVYHPSNDTGTVAPLSTEEAAPVTLKLNPGVILGCVKPLALSQMSKLLPANAVPVRVTKSAVAADWDKFAPCAI